jgi:hypothetical protein
MREEGFIRAELAVNYLVVDDAARVLPKLRAALAGVDQRDLSMAVSPDVL